jgi:hypothetical protein
MSVALVQNKMAQAVTSDFYLGNARLEILAVMQTVPSEGL